MEGDAILLNEVGRRPLEVLRDRGMIPPDYPPEWLPNTGKPWFGPEYHLPVNVAPSGATDPGPARVQTHAEKCGIVGATGAHGDLGENKA